MNTPRVRFQADANLDMTIVRGLRRIQPSIDFQSAEEASLRGVSDPVVLELAAREGRILVSHDKTTIPTHFILFLQQGNHSPGVFLLPQGGPLRESIEALLIVWQCSVPEEWIDHLEYLPWHS